MLSRVISSEPEWSHSSDHLYSPVITAVIVHSLDRCSVCNCSYAAMGWLMHPAHPEAYELGSSSGCRLSWVEVPINIVERARLHRIIISSTRGVSGLSWQHPTPSRGRGCVIALYDVQMPVCGFHPIVSLVRTNLRRELNKIFGALASSSFYPHNCRCSGYMYRKGPNGAGQKGPVQFRG